MNQIIAEWLQGKVPVVNGVIEAGGQVHRVCPVDLPRMLPMTLRENGPTEFARLPSVEWTIALPFEKVRDAGSEMIAIVGECGMGSDGFVAIQATERPDSLLWVAFFDFSNPFESVRLEGSLIKALNNRSAEWRFARSAPWRIEIHPAS